MMITTANFTDRKGAIDMVSYYCECTDNLSQIKKMLVDGGYTGQNFADRIKEITGAKVEVVKRNELHTLWKNAERLLHNSFQMFSIAFIRIILRRY